jgi:hypothetical protein
MMRRLSRLETQQREESDDGGCRECGAGGGGPTVFNIPSPKCFGDPPDERDDTSRDFCGTCGRRVVFRIPSPRIMGREDAETPL